jgi:perosamine synthetase
VWPSLKANRFAEEGLYLPTYTSLTEADQEYITDRVRKFYGC